MQSAETTREAGTATSTTGLAEGAEGTTATTTATPPSPGSVLESLGLSKGLLEFVEMQREFHPTPSQAQVQGLPMKEYLEVTLLPVLLEGLKAVVRERWVVGWLATSAPRVAWGCARQG
jgi:hypothetical protein